MLSLTVEETPCSRVRCAAYSQCFETPEGHPECRCLPGYKEIDNQPGCRPNDDSPPVDVDCRQQNRCHINAQCAYNSQQDKYRCQCLNGFRGDGFTCTLVSGT